jgi:hypothetical protein
MFCRGLREDLAPISLAEYELRLKQSVVNERHPGTPLVVSEHNLLLHQAMIQLSPEEERKVGSLITDLKTNPNGLFDHDYPNFKLASAPFQPGGGSTTATWTTKSSLLASQRVRDSLAPVIETKVVSLTQLSIERPLVLSEDVVVVSAGASILWLQAGEKRFEFKTTSVIGGAAALLEDGTVVIGRGRTVYWLKDGLKRYEFTATEDFRSGPAVLSDGSIVIGSDDDHVYWLKDGVKLNAYKTFGDVRSAPALLSDDTVVVGSTDGRVYWLKSGQKMFEFQSGGAVLGSPVVMWDGTVVIGSTDDYVYWLKDGRKRFSYKTGGDVVATGVLLSDGTVVIGSEDYTLYWLRDGQKSYEFQGQVRASPAVLADDTVIVGVGLSLHWLKNGFSRLSFQSDLEHFGSPVMLETGTVLVTSMKRQGAAEGRLSWLD